MKLSLLLLVVALMQGVSGCSSSPSDPTYATSEQAPPPAEGLHPDSLPFPVYPKFSDIEPLFHKNNDTTYVVNFWATWCKPCIAELPYFEKLHKDYRNQPVQVLLISMDFPKDLHKKLLPFVRERQLQAPVLALIDMNYNAWIDKVSQEWDGAIPFTLVYKKDKREIKLGEMEDYAELEGLLKKMIR